MQLRYDTGSRFYPDFHRPQDDFIWSANKKNLCLILRNSGEERGTIRFLKGCFRLEAQSQLGNFLLKLGRSRKSQGNYQ